MEDPSLRFNHVKEDGLLGCPPEKTVADSKGSTSRGTQSSHRSIARRGVPSWNKQPIGGKWQYNYSEYCVAKTSKGKIPLRGNSKRGNSLGKRKSRKPVCLGVMGRWKVSGHELEVFVSPETGYVSTKLPFLGCTAEQWTPASLAVMSGQMTVL